MTQETNPYRCYIRNIREQYEQAQKIAPPPHSSEPISNLSVKAPTFLIFSPHPDDETITGLLPLRFALEASANIVNIAVTLGSNPKRRETRWNELQQACHCLHFACERLDIENLSEISGTTSSSWSKITESIHYLLEAYQPKAVFLPHAEDAHPTHRAVYKLISESLQFHHPLNHPLHLFYTEYWSTMSQPNVMIEASDDHLAKLMLALSYHKGEISRHPYHLTLPAWMMDNARRGSEVMHSHGAAKTKMLFSTLYRWQIFDQGAFYQPPSQTLILESSYSTQRIIDLF